MDIREELINAKTNGMLTKVAAEKLAPMIQDFAGFSYFFDKLAEDYGFGSDPIGFDPIPSKTGLSKLKELAKKKGLLASAVLAGVSGPMVINYLRTKKKHKQILDALKSHEDFQDKQKVENIYNMLSSLAPKSMMEPTYAKAIMDQMYNAPAIQAPMLKDIVEIEEKAHKSGKGGKMTDILKGMEHIPKIIGFGAGVA